jgi:hypothetical protein
MRRRFKGWNPSIRQLEDLKKSGKVRDYTVTPVKVLRNGKPINKSSKQKVWISWQLAIWCSDRGLEWKIEFSFHPKRGWRFDWAIPALKIAIEYEGLLSPKSRHTTIAGYTGDTEKYNSAISLGWRVLRFTALNYINLLVELEQLTSNQIDRKP